MFGVSGSEAEDIHEKQSRRKQGFGAFLRQMKEDRSVEDRLRLLPWNKGDLPEPLSFADDLIRESFRSGISSTVSTTSKQKGLLQAMGWAWLVVHKKTESDAWRFDKESRDKGGDWVPYLSALYDAGMSILNTDDGSEQEYRAAMIALASACGVSIE